MNSLEELIEHVKIAEYWPKLLDRIWFTYQQCMIKTLEVNGRNCYKIPHMCKQALSCQGLLPTLLEVPNQLVNQTIAPIDAQNEEEAKDESS